MNDDTDLLLRYSETGSDAAFTELVRRYVDLVFGAAMRRTGGDAHLSADVSQHVFTALARNARMLASDTVLAAWLHTATRNAALKLMISEQRRRARESVAGALHEVNATTGPLDWEKLRSLLDSEIDALPAADRTSLVLRFFERRPFAEIGAKLRISEDAARMRTERALEKLRVGLSRHGISSTGTALAAVVTAQPLVSAPAGLAATLAAHSLAAVSAGTIGATLATFMTAKIIIPVTLSAIAAFAIGAYSGLNHARAEPPPLVSPSPQLTQTITSLRDENHRLSAEVERLKSGLSQTEATNAALQARVSAAARAAAASSTQVGRSPNLGVERYELQQAVLNNLRQIAAARDQYIKANGRPPEGLHVLVGRTSDKYIKTVRTVGGEDYSGLAMTPGGALTVTTPDGIVVTYDPSGATTTTPEVPPQVARLKALQQRLEPVVNKAVGAYLTANNGKQPANEQALLPYFATPQEGADFLEFVEAQKAATGH
jgi:RNA polymerase sigma factor (sigma-70 family)